jgi:hypothetical protein
MFPLFSNGTMLAGLAALAIPVIIHLLLKRKPLRLPFSTIQFFLMPEENATRKRKLRHWLLLSSRLLLLTLIILAFAKPYLPEGGTAPETGPVRQVVFVLDQSASMLAGSDQANRWIKAREIIRGSLDELSARDQAALVGCGDGGNLIPQWSAPLKLKQDLDDLRPGWGGSDLSQGLEEAVKMISRKRVSDSVRIHLISDLQRNACLRLGDVVLPDWIEFKISSVAEADFHNLAISELRVQGAGQASAEISVINHSTEDRGPVHLDLMLAGKPVSTGAVRVPPGKKTNLVLALPNLDPGWHAIEARLRGRDDFGADDIRYAVAHRPEPIRVVLVETRTSKRSYEEATFFVGAALDPGANGAAAGSLFQVEKMSPDEMSRVRRDANSRTDLLILPGMRQLPSGAGHHLEQFVGNGGALLLFLGEDVSAAHYNRELGGLLPARLVRMEGNLERPEEFLRMEDFVKDSSLFAAFAQSDVGDLKLPAFRRHFTLAPLESALIHARFHNKTPFILEREVGSGKVLLVNTSADITWTDWPKRKTFLPWLHSLSYHLVGGGPGREIIEDGISGGAYEWIPARTTGENLRVRTPDDRVVEARLENAGQARFPIDAPGFYRVQNEAGADLRWVAVNLPRAESEPDSYSALEARDRITRSSGNPPEMTGSFREGVDRKELWRILLACGVVLLVFEVFLANRTFA